MQLTTRKYITKKIEKHFFLFRSNKILTKQKKYIENLKSNFNYQCVKDINEALLFSKSEFNKTMIFDVASCDSPVKWFVDSANHCFKKNIHSLVNGPLSKEIIFNHGYNFIGHTGYLRSQTKKNLKMAFIGKYFNLLLATDHIPLSKVETSLTKDVLFNSIESAIFFKKTLRLKKPIAILGLNPHAGENGLIGDFERKVIHPVIKKFSSQKIIGPLPADTAFFDLSKYSIIISLYHDQGLIPFKMLHGQNSGAQITIGLPFIRTSVDHGTAFDIFNKDQANPNSMIEAILTAISR